MIVTLTLRFGENKSKPMDKNNTESFVNQMWDDSIIPELCEYIRIPNKSPMFDPDWEQHGYMEQAVKQFERWCREQPIKGMQVEVVKLEGRTPILFIDIPGDTEDVVLLYGHYDKPVSYTHLTLPTNREVYVCVVAVSQQ